MRIIALTGAPSRGKTTTLTMVYDHMIELGGESTNRQPLPPTDFSDIVLFKNEKIAFFTMGDYQGKLLKAISDYNELDADLLICACTDKPALRVVRNVIEKFQHDFYEKTVAEPRTEELKLAANTNDMNAIFVLI